MIKKFFIKNKNKENESKTLKKSIHINNVLNSDQCKEKLLEKEEIFKSEYNMSNLKEADFCLLEESPFYIHRVRNSFIYLLNFKL